MKFEIGDRVRIKNPTTGITFRTSLVGRVGTVIYVDPHLDTITNRPTYYTVEVDGNVETSIYFPASYLETAVLDELAKVMS